jgi:phenylacetate-CoA ligase
MRVEIERALGLAAVNFYGLSEMCGPGVASECLHARAGLHVHEDHFLVEVVDGDGRPVAAGAEGELVFTTLRKQALPLIRYRTGDIGRVIDGPCPCGRTTVRLTGLTGRHDDMLIVRGVNLYPSQVEQVLLSVEGATPHYRLIVERTGPMDELTLECEATDESDRESLSQRVEAVLKEQTGLRIAVRVLDPGRLPRSDGKAVRVLDRRSVAG